MARQAVRTAGVRSAGMLTRHAPVITCGKALAFLLSVAGGSAGLFAQPPEMPPAPVVATRVVREQFAPTQSFVGTVRPLKTATIGSAVDGRVAEFLVNEGERVEQGQPLARLLTETIELELSAAESELELKQSELAELENGTRPEEKARAKAEMLSAKARMEYFQSRRLRAEGLYRNGQATSAEERDEAISAAVAAEQAYEKFVADYDLALAGPRREQIEQARSRVAMQQAAVQLLQDRLVKHTLISRFDGFVTAEFTEIGAWVKQGDPLVEVAALDEVEVIAYVVEQSIAFVTIGAEVPVEIPALANRDFSGLGTVANVVPQADERARTFPVIVRVKNIIEDDTPLLKSGMLARVHLPTGPAQQALLVPKDALVMGGPQPAVFVIQPNADNNGQGIVQPVPVELGVADQKLIAVQGGLEEGQLVVVMGNERLRPGQEVTVAQLLDSDFKSPGGQAP